MTVQGVVKPAPGLDFVQPPHRRLALVSVRVARSASLGKSGPGRLRYHACGRFARRVNAGTAGHPNMPKLELGRAGITDLADYIAALK